LPVKTFDIFQPFDSMVTFDGDAPGDAPNNIDSTRLLYIESNPIAINESLPWSLTYSVSDDLRAQWGLSTSTATDLQITWEILRSISAQDRIAWADVTGIESSELLPWVEIESISGNKRIDWGDCQQRVQDYENLLWGNTESVFESKRLDWANTIAFSAETRSLWGELIARGAYVAIPWGGSGNYRVGYDIPYGTDVPGTPAHVYHLPNLPVYFMLPSFSVMAGGDNLNVTSAKFHFDDASYSGTFEATVPSDRFHFVDPNLFTDPAPVTITINGFAVVMQAESYRDNRAFKQDTHTVTGRGLSAQLGPDFAPLKTYTETSDKNASQLATQELASTGWTLVWAAADWLVPAGKWTYSNLTPIQAIAQLAAIVGAVVIPDPIANTLTVQPTYKNSPWAWTDAMAFAVIPAELIPSVSGSWDGKSHYNGVFVTGQSGGVRVPVKRTGTDGANSLPDVSDPLIVSVVPARERGRYELAKSTKIKTDTLTMPLLPGPISADNPGPIMPGNIIKYLKPDGSHYLGLVRSLDVSATRSGATITVRQTINVDIHQ
jgi:hypothetical protein